MKFPVSSHLSEFLLAFEEAQSTERLAVKMGCSPSVVFRNLQAIADLGGFVVKINGRWRISPLGRRMNAVTRRSIRRQRDLLERPYSPVVGYSPALFSDLCVATAHGMLLEQACSAEAFLACDPLKAEDRVACGEIDFVITDKVPSSPAFRYQVLRTFTQLPVISSNKLGPDPLHHAEMVSSLPFICSKYQEVPAELSPLCLASRSRFEVEGVGTCLEYVGAGLGWSLIPSYLLTNDLRARHLVPLPGRYRPQDRRLLVLWLRGREIPTAIVKTLGALFQPPERRLLSVVEEAVVAC